MAGLPEATHSVGREADVDVLVERCAGLDVHRDTVVATVRVPAMAKGRPRREQFTRTFATTTAGITALGDWLGEHRITRVGMESTGVYWKPVYYLLEDQLEVWLIKADRRELERRARDRGAPAREVERARIVLLAADGVPGQQIAEMVGCAEGTVVTWRGRYAERGLAGWRTCRDRASPRRCPRRCGIGCCS